MNARYWPTVLLAALFTLFAISPPGSRAATNEWTKPTSGYWEEAYWSLGHLPSTLDDVLFANDGYKALAIGASTTANYPNSLSIKKLRVYGGNNLLLLNYSGMNVPLRIASNFVLGLDASLLSYYASVVASNFYVGGRATFAELSQAKFKLLQVGTLSATNAELVISNAVISSDALHVGDTNGSRGVINQYGGTIQITGTNWNEQRGSAMAVFPSNVYNIRGGTLRAPLLDLYGSGSNSSQFIISGGLVQVDSLASSTSGFQLQSGELETPNMGAAGGTWRQSGGRNTVGTLWVAFWAPGNYLLTGGTLLSSNVGAGSFDAASGALNQSGGLHINSVRITLNGAERTGHHNWNGGYILSGGFLSTPRLANSGGFFRQSGGTNLARDVVLDFSGAYTLTGGSLECSNLNLTAREESGLQIYTPCTFLHSNGVNTVKNQLIMDPPAGLWYSHYTRGSLYRLYAGTLNTHFVDMRGDFMQAGGLHNNDQIVMVHGGYSLSAGALGSPQLFVDGAGRFTQTGGTNSPQFLFIDQRAAFNLGGGTLSTSNTTVSGGDRSTGTTNRATFTQSNGTHVVQNELRVDGIFRLNGGTLSAPNLTIDPDGDLWLAGGVLNNSDRLTMYDGVCYAQGQQPNLGKLSVRLGPLSRTTNANVTTLDLQTGSTVLRFKDSHDTAAEWNGRLAIRNWSGSIYGGGADQVFVGTTAQGLTAAQLQRISFLNPDGLPPGTYPARILANGEIVPASGPTLGFSRRSQGLIVSWTGNYELWTTTNLLSPWTLIPGATSPYTNSFPGSQRFFKLRSATP